MKSEKGFSLIEVMIAIALLGIVSVAFLSAMGTASMAIFIADEQATAESLARSEMEYVRNQDYSVAPWAYELPLPPGWPDDSLPEWWDEDNPPTLPTGYDGYTVTVSAEPLYAANDIQKITLIVKHQDKPEVVKLEGYRSMR
jgi:prepilin-type N-terminal cleavage/methylation domain-containing protein